MKRIQKSKPEPAALTAWKKGKKWMAAPPSWKTFPTVSVRPQLVSDQRGLCCYCCASITGGIFHIEHYRSREHFPKDTYAWSNMLASCEGVRPDPAAQPTIATQDHCGTSKKNGALSVNPQSLGVEGKFRHTLDGKIHPSKTLHAAEYASVEQDIVLLNLRAPALIARRKALIDKAIQDTDSMTMAQWQAHYLNPAAPDDLQEFWPALKYSFDRFKDQWWPQASAPGH